MISWKNKNLTQDRDTASLLMHIEQLEESEGWKHVMRIIEHEAENRQNLTKSVIRNDDHMRNHNENITVYLTLKSIPALLQEIRRECGVKQEKV